MATKLTSSGSGKIKDNSIISFSYSEDITSLEPSSINGGSSQVTISAIEETSDAGLINTKLMINNTASLTDDVYGTVQFDVKNVSTNAGGVATIVGDSVQNKLNVIKTAASFNGTLSAAITYYCGLCGVTPTVDSALNGRSVKFIGWSGNVWDYLKMLCSVITYNTTDRSSIEMYFNGTTVGFRPASTNTLTIEDYQSDFNQSVETFNAAETIDVYSYNTEYKSNAIVYDINYYDSNYSNPKKAFLSSFSDSLQVEAGETIVKRFTIDATLSSIKQPDCVATISPLPYNPSTSGNGQYVIVGSDNLPIQPAQWIAQGGSLVVALTENPNEIQITITAPADKSLLQNTGIKYGFAPYRVGVETSGGGFDYPSLYIVGTGMFYKKIKTTFITGANSSNVSAAEIDNIFIIDDFTLANAGMAAAQAVCGPNIYTNGSSASGFVFGSTIGKSFKKNSNKFRLDTVDFSANGVSWHATDSATFSDFDAINSGKTFTQFNSIVTTSMFFNEFSIIPLTTGV